MQTFLTCADDVGALRLTYRTAQELDSKRLGKQRVEAKQIYNALTEGKGWINHTATKMWEGKPEALATYGFVICQVWRERGYQDTLMEWFAERATLSLSEGFQPDSWPWWYGHTEMVASHRSKLVEKLPGFYVPKFQENLFEHYGSTRLPYLWPDPEVDGLFRLSISEYLRKDFELPDHWHVNSERVVTFS